MTRSVFLTAVFSAAVFQSAFTAQGIVLVNDTWKDSTRTDPAAPNYSENGVDLDLDGDLESAWYLGGAGTDQAFLAPVGPGGPLRLDLTPNLTQQSSITTYFAPEADPVTLDVGERLKITFAFTPTLVASEGIDISGQSFRFAVVNTPADGRISTDVSPNPAMYSGYAVLMNTDRPNFQGSNGFPFELKERTDPNTAAGLLSSAGSWTHLGNGATNGNPSFATGTQYTFTFEAERTAAGALDILTRMTGTGLDGDGVAEVSYLDTTPNGGSFTFDTFAMRLNTGYQTFGVMDISLFRVEVISPGIPGDVNDDGIVNGLDISLVASHWLQTGDPSSLAGDANADGVVNGLDISLIASHWLQSSGGSGEANAASVPEPASLALFGLGMVLGGGYLRRARRAVRIAARG